MKTEDCGGEMAMMLGRAVGTQQQYEGVNNTRLLLLLLLLKGLTRMIA